MYELGDLLVKGPPEDAPRALIREAEPVGLDGKGGQGRAGEGAGRWWGWVRRPPCQHRLRQAAQPYLLFRPQSPNMLPCCQDQRGKNLLPGRQLLNQR